MSNTLFVHLSRWSRSSKFLFKEHALIWNKARDLCLLGNFKVCYRREEVLSVIKGKFLLQQEKQYQGSFEPYIEIFLVDVIRFITLYRNPWLTNITLSSSIFIINIYMANFARVDCIINMLEIHINVNTDKKVFR